MNLLSNPKFSIITIVKNDSEGLRRTANSVLSQTYDDFEYIVINGDSDEEILNEITFLEQKAICVSEPDLGISDAFNKGLKIASGQWINFLNAGDTFVTNGILKEVSNTILEHSHCKIVSGYAKFGRNTIPKRAFKNHEPLHVKAMLSHQASFITRDIFDEIGSFDLTFKIRMDYDLWLRILKSHSFCLIDKIWVKYDLNGLSSLGSNIKKFFEEEKKANQKNGVNNYRVINAILDFRCFKARVKYSVFRFFI
ncbi:glycosyltransferase family 2 protein [Leptothoe kymatousa]|uniref:Glycosyltransferase n=1 Tax=Leptothoe kymatousa TAU-MAC 1615 TaxID=2364775 RepID=A0ABS5Y585_9CYAN|nr:glycosyltransferase family 2 protein [Leptothoe kymatousa]MBT9312998.1 glycosyltransferase [Leptothoe kymatousa TAU-MAC 1615]